MEKETKQNNTHKKTFTGTVVSTAMKDTLVVEVRQYKKHARYGKYSVQRKKYKVHSPENAYEVGDTVVFAPSRPISKTKRFHIIGKK